jgi:hypothetical protein
LDVVGQLKHKQLESEHWQVGALVSLGACSSVRKHEATKTVIGTSSRRMLYCTCMDMK